MHWKTGIPTEKGCHYLIEHPHPGYGQYSVRWVSENERCDLYDWANLHWLVIEDQTDYSAVRAEEALDDLRLWARDGECFPAFSEFKAADVLEHVDALQKEIKSLEAMLAIKGAANARLRRDRDEAEMDRSNLIEVMKSRGPVARAR